MLKFNRIVTVIIVKDLNIIVTHLIILSIKILDFQFYLMIIEYYFLTLESKADVAIVSLIIVETVVNKNSCKWGIALITLVT